MRTIVWSAFGLFSFLTPLSAVAVNVNEDVKLQQSADRVRVEIGGKLFTEFVFRGAPKTYFFPVLAPDGTEMTVNGDPAPKYDQHHRSLFFAHGDVNGAVFWNDKDETKGRMVNETVGHSVTGRVGEIRYRNRWVGPDGTIHLFEQTKVQLQATADSRTIDYEVTLNAPKDKPVVLGDTKEGTMAIRFPRWMTPTHAIRGYSHTGKGVIVNAESCYLFRPVTVPPIRPPESIPAESPVSSRKASL